MEKVSGILSNVPAVANYESLREKPQINGVELSGNKIAVELGLASADQVKALQNMIDGLIDGNEVAY